MNIVIKFFTKSNQQHSCTRKVRYGHQETAARATREMHAKTFKEYETYECQYCGGWHIATKEEP